MVLVLCVEAVTLVVPGPPCSVEVLKPSWRMTAARTEVSDLLDEHSSSDTYLTDQPFARVWRERR